MTAPQGGLISGCSAYHLAIIIITVVVGVTISVSTVVVVASTWT